MIVSFREINRIDAIGDGIFCGAIYSCIFFENKYGFDEIKFIERVVEYFSGGIGDEGGAGNNGQRINLNRVCSKWKHLIACTCQLLSKSSAHRKQKADNTVYP